MQLNEIIKSRILIFGSNGMLGQRLTEFFLNQNVELLTSSFEEFSYIQEAEYKQCDITDRIKTKKLIFDFYPDYIINAAAYTNVDKSEFEKENAWRVNVKAVEYISQAARVLDSHIIHISSDYIFDGENGPYLENATPNPIGYYGRTKLASENVLKLYAVKHTIIRTNVLYGPTQYGRPDFVKWVIDSLKNKNQIRIVTDQINNPTFIDDLVQAIAKIIELKKEGIYNIGGQDFLSRYDFTMMIADYFGLDKDLVTPILTKDLNQPARRPLKSGLITIKAQSEIGYRPHSYLETFKIIKEEFNL
ncbi:MAG: dTDP-4-dehydrorhamnose reductase [Ignavibacterium sp.]|nr:dTDP-4-dehydrorhamnose reductase [Ignavibacterium sp.]MDW8374266.1 dTDP-4-dehydrorhamnose reductase [Ignavibacteriales bacterium]